MLTDYHIHLRPDDPGARAADHFTQENALRYLEVAGRRGVGELGFAEHIHRFRQALDVWRHPFWEANAIDDLDEYCAFVDELKVAGHPVRLGLEADWIPHREDRTQELIEARDWDYVLGSVHFLADDAVDCEDYDAWRRRTAEDVWTAYFRALGDAAASGLFDALAHPDLVKVWGRGRPSPPGDPRRYYELAMEKIAGSDVAVEVSTAGLRKPVGEIYPSRALLDLCLEAGKPIVLSSDAHRAEDVGQGYGEALAFLRDAGVDRICTFTGRQRSEVELEGEPTAPQQAPDGAGSS